MKIERKNIWFECLEFVSTFHFAWIVLWCHNIRHTHTHSHVVQSGQVFQEAIFVKTLVFFTFLLDLFKDDVDSYVILANLNKHVQLQFNDCPVYTEIPTSLPEPISIQDLISIDFG